MPPASVAEAYWQLYQQPRSAWVFEQEIRPFGEKMVRSVSAGDGTAARLAPEGTSTVTTALPGEPGAKSAPPNQADTVAEPG
jgi:hypothetical protein